MPDQYVNGRRALLQCLDSVLAEDKNIKIFKEYFEDQIESNTEGFLKGIVLPLMPKDVGEKDEKDGEVSAIQIQFVPAKPPEKKAG